MNDRMIKSQIEGVGRGRKNKAVLIIRARGIKVFMQKDLPAQVVLIGKGLVRSVCMGDDERAVGFIKKHPALTGTPLIERGISLWAFLRLVRI